METTFSTVLLHVIEYMPQNGDSMAGKLAKNS